LRSAFGVFEKPLHFALDFWEQHSDSFPESFQHRHSKGGSLLCENAERPIWTRICFAEMTNVFESRSQFSRIASAPIKTLTWNMSIPLTPRAVGVKR
jgi:hypothetical protein